MNDQPLTSNSVPTKIALGCMGMSGVYGKTDDAMSIAVISILSDVRRCSRLHSG